jgi:hypothetical protein
LTNLTVNAGVRYDFMSPAFERDNRMANFDGQGGIVLAEDGSLRARGLVKPDRNNVAPRVGVTYALTPTWVLRTGYGMFYNLYDRIGSEDQLSLNPPFLINNSVTASGGTPLFVLQDGFPANFLDPGQLDLRRIRIRAINPAGDKSYFHQWSAGLQTSLTSRIVLSADYVGTKGIDLWTLRNLNQPDPVTKALPYATLGPVEYADQDGTSTYHGLELSVERRLSNHIGFRVAYTLSKATDNAGEHLFSGGSPSFLQDARDRDSWEGPADADTRHRLAANWIAEVPLGFVFSGIVTGRTGRPFTVTQSSNNVGQLMTGLPNRVGSGKGEETADRWFDTTAFQAVPSGTVGNSGRNILRGPGLWNVDASLSRRFSLGGQRAAEARWEVFNVLNSTQFGLPDTISAQARSEPSRVWPATHG